MDSGRSLENKNIQLSKSEAGSEMALPFLILPYAILILAEGERRAGVTDHVWGIEELLNLLGTGETTAIGI